MKTWKKDALLFFEDENSHIKEQPFSNDDELDELEDLDEMEDLTELFERGEIQ